MNRYNKRGNPTGKWIEEWYNTTEEGVYRDGSRIGIWKAFNSHSSLISKTRYSDDLNNYFYVRYEFDENKENMKISYHKYTLKHIEENEWTQ